MTVPPRRRADAVRLLARTGLARAGLAGLAGLAALAPGALAAQTPAAAAVARLTPDTLARPAVTLADAIRRAEQVQPSVAQARGNVRSAEARTRSATLGAYLPDVNFSTSGSNNYSGGDATTTASGQVIPGGRTVNSFNTGVSASLDLFTGFRRGADARAARASETAADASLVNARFQQALTTTNTFFDALSAQQLVSAREAGVRRAEEQLKVSVAKLQAGSATRSDSLRSTVTLGTAQLQLIQAQVQLATAEANLARLVGAPGRVRAADDSAFYRPVVLDTAALRAEALAQSPQVQSATASAAAAAAAERAARAAYWPSLTLGGSLGWNGSDAVRSNNPSPNLFDLNPNRQVSLRLSWSLFNGFQREQTIAQQAATADVAEAQAADARRQVEAGLVAALAQLDAAHAQVAITQTSVAAAREDLRVVQERYRLGASTIVDVLTSQENLNQAEVDVVNARYAFLRAKAQLEALIGRPL